MKTMKKLLMCGTLLATTLSLASCSSSKNADNNNKNKALNVTMMQEPATADPNKGTDVYSMSLVNQTMEGLYDVTNTGKVVPGVATKVVKPSNNGKVYVFNLRKDAKWQNGQPVTAQDFVTSFDRQVNPTTKSQFANRFQYFKNYDAVHTGKAPVSKLGVKALGTHKLQVTLSQADPNFNYRAASEFYPLNTAAVKKYGQQYGTSSTKMVANGPFTLSNWNPSKDTWQYKKNSKFWDAKNVKLPSVSVQVVKDPNTAQELFASKKVQETLISGEAVSQDAKEYKNNMVYTKKGTMRYLNFSKNNKFTSNTNFRLAVSYALNRKQLVNDVLKNGASPAKSIVPEKDGTDHKNGKDFNDELSQTLTYDKQKAQSYWKKAQKELGTNKATVDLLTEDDSDQKKLGEWFQSSVQSTLKGVKINVTSLPLQQEINRLFGKKYEIAATGWSTSYPDPADYLSVMTKNNVVNFTQLSNPKYEKAMDQVNKASGDKRWKLMVKAGDLGMTWQPMVPTYQDTDVHLVSSEVGGLKYSLLTNSLYRYAYWK